jgi:hypothetical protein
MRAAVSKRGITKNAIFIPWVGYRTATFYRFRYCTKMLNLHRSIAVPDKDERVELELKILKARQLARQADDTTRERLEGLAAELEQGLRKKDE